MSRVTLVELEGDIDLARAPELREELRRSVDNQDLALIVDLTAVHYLDSAGVNVFFEVADELKRRRIALAGVVPEGGVLDRVIQLVDLRSVARVERTVEAAVAAYDDSGS
jgi:anti-sigma B factor antagonist